MKRLRKRYGRGIRVFYCGEYGDCFGRPHYHACLFNHDFADKVVYKVHNGNRYYISDELSELWPYGHCIVGDVTFESACYVARYVCKKVTGYAADFHYCYVDPVTGEWCWRVPEFGHQSRNGGLGKGWFEKYRSDVFDGSGNDDFVVIRGARVQVPKFYKGLYELEDVRASRKVKARRVSAALKHADDQTPARLLVREKVKQAQVSHLKRGYENEGV